MHGRCPQIKSALKHNATMEKGDYNGKGDCYCTQPLALLADTWQAMIHHTTLGAYALSTFSGSEAPVPAVVLKLQYASCRGTCTAQRVPLLHCSAVQTLHGPLSQGMRPGLRSATLVLYQSRLQ